MRVSLQYKLLAAFMAVVILVLAGVSVGGSTLIRDYFIARKQHELTDKAYEMARMVNDYYNGNITHGQLHNFVNRVDSFLDARVWVVDNNLNLITVSEERPDEGQGNRGRVIKPSPMHPAVWDCEVSGHQGGKMMHEAGQQAEERQETLQQNQDKPAGSKSSQTDDRRSSRHNKMGGMRGHAAPADQPVQPSRSMAAIVPPDNPPAAANGQQNSIVLDIGNGPRSGDTPGSAISLTEIKGMDELSREIKANSGKSWFKTYYHPYYEENMLIVAVPLTRTDGTISGTVMINAPVGEINSFLQNVYYYLALAGLTAVLLAGLLSAYMARHIVQPLKTMQEIAASLACGDYERRVEVNTRDEIGDLGKSVNLLAKDLGDYVRQLEQTDKMRRDFVANVSHELRTPLTIMHGYNQALQDGTITDPAKAKKYHRVIGDEILRLEKLIAELLDLSQLQAGGIMLETEDVLLAEVVDNVILLLKQKSEQCGVALIADIDPAVLPIQGDGDRLTQLVLILMDNALKFTPAGGRITVHLSAEDRTITLDIADTGTGIAPADLPYVWERFYKADKSRASGGTGLGLAIARQIIEMHRATVNVTSACGEGTTFTIRFPLEKNDAACSLHC